MPAPWFLLFFFVQAGDLMSDVLADVWMDDDAPSCEELRSVWSSISRTGRTSESTNEIPIMPWDDYSPHRHHHLEKGRRKPKTTSLITNAFLDIFMEEADLSSNHPNPPLVPFHVPSPHSQNNVPTHGHFGDFERGPPNNNRVFPDSANTLPGTRKKAGSDSEFYGLPDEVGSFGRFLDDFDGDFPLANSRDRQGWPPGDSAPFGSPSLDVMQETCLQIQNRDCTVNEQCACIGWNTLKCIRGKCNSLHLKADKENEHGSWHHGPLPYSKLGRQKRPRRSNKHTIM